ncbi:MAG: V-type ATP synthase subunit D [Spirochaetaceae bacterium]|nr:MAG: V-type ATP synthase subunit D [Spirochaetaceae bacterium]
MGAVKLTKNELKRQKDSLKRFKRYLPTLQLKKQQLQMMIRQVEHEEAQKRAEREEVRKILDGWIEVFGEPVDFENLLEVESLVTEDGNIAGIDIPIFKEIRFKDIAYDLFAYPLWVDAALDKLKEMLTIDAELVVLEEQRKRLEQELRITTQRVNLFEKVKIPEAQENIRMIRIYLGDQQTAAVVRGKISKNKIEAVD